MFNKTTQDEGTISKWQQKQRKINLLLIINKKNNYKAQKILINTNIHRI